MDDKKTSREPRSIAEIDYPILCKHFGRQKANEIMLMAKALHEETRIQLGLNEQEERRDS